MRSTFLSSAFVPLAAFLICGALVIAGLVYGADLLVPLAAAGLLAATLAPLVQRLKHAGVPRVATVVLCVSLLVSGFTFVAAVIGTQVADLARDLPKYEFSMRVKLRAIARDLPEEGVIGQAAATLQRLGRDLEKSAAPAPRPPDGGAPPVAVQVQAPPLTPGEIAGGIIGRIAHPAISLGLAVLLLVFLLLEHEQFAHRLSRSFGESRMEHVRAAFDDIVLNIGRYLQAMLALNTTFGVVIGLGLFALGVPNALLWGLVGAVLRLVPYAGVPLASIGPLLVAIAVGDGWLVPILVLVLFLGLELVIGNLVEPILYGSRAGLSPLVLLLAAAFWGAVWGGIGLMLSTPLTVCLAVLGRHVPQLRFVSELVGAEPKFNPQYDRLRRKRVAKA
ncbi:MAG: AI-2E family transporter [Alphaproteobacteria bacterium]|nr:AI-2E family transporter [Alphaproteobacteria bacterium]MCW5742843.1 AI-2E family transporter [Alphaproteobacteria bacterium]